jgi:hypothetical protein
MMNKLFLCFALTLTNTLASQGDYRNISLSKKSEIKKVVTYSDRALIQRSLTVDRKSLKKISGKTVGWIKIGPLLPRLISFS